jgi:phenylacetate-coenzyme A ligase PaaK-like adenylate-forming protein
MKLNNILSAVFTVISDKELNDLSLEIFRFQASSNPVYKEYIGSLTIDPGTIDHYSKIPFMPIGFFKNHCIYCADHEPEMVFRSSGTTGSLTSRHCVADLGIYEKSFSVAFRRFYGDPEQLRIFALLPSYRETGGSSLIYMAERLINKSSFSESGFYNTDSKTLAGMLNEKEKKTLVLGVSYALLDLVEVCEIRNPGLIVMETGGMKGRRKEMVREELHKILKQGFGVTSIHSEYGMTELLSQAYSKGEGRFRTPPWMKVLIRDANDPLSLIGDNQTGGINVIDLANLYSCSFIATEDLGKSYPNGEFEVLGRFDASDIRGCNLLAV